jgi:prepilin-type N-terminal cleavage/methylation domain-containing protein
MAMTEKGHTLIELMFVLSIAGILTVLAVSDLGTGVSHYRLRNAGQQLASDLRLIRQKAISEGLSHKIQFIPGSRKYHLPELGDQTLPADVRFGVRPGVPHLPDAGSMPSDGISFSENKVTFQPNGTIVGIGGTVYLTGDMNRQDALAITVNVTGRVKIYKWNGGEWK